MSAQITLNLPDRLYKRVKSLAQARDQEIAEAIAEYLDNHLPTTEAEIADPFPSSEQIGALEKEKFAYLRLHPILKQEYFGRFVAIYNEKLLDVDEDFSALSERVRSRLPNQIVWMSKVEDEPIKTIVMRSPRFINGGK